MINKPEFKIQVLISSDIGVLKDVIPLLNAVMLSHVSMYDVIKNVLNKVYIEYLNNWNLMKEYDDDRNTNDNFSVSFSLSLHSNSIA